MIKTVNLLPLLLGFPFLASCSMLMQSIDDIRDVPEARGIERVFPYEFADVLPVIREALGGANLILQEDEEVAPGRQVLFFRTTLMKFDADPGVIGRMIIAGLDERCSIRLYTAPLTPTAMVMRDTESYADQLFHSVDAGLRPKAIEDRFEKLKEKRAGGGVGEEQGGER